VGIHTAVLSLSVRFIGSLHQSSWNAACLLFCRQTYTCNGDPLRKVFPIITCSLMVLALGRLQGQTFEINGQSTQSSKPSPARPARKSAPKSAPSGKSAGQP